jgi:hypothetical protein
MKNALEGEKAYNRPPNNKFSKVKGKGGKKNDEDEENFDEDTNYLNMRDLRKKKPAP